MSIGLVCYSRVYGVCMCDLSLYFGLYVPHFLLSE